MARYKALDLPSYWAGINAELDATTDPGGRITKVRIISPRDIVRQRLGYGAMYEPRLTTP